MANFLGAGLAQLVRERCYVGGKAAQLEQQAAAARDQLRDLGRKRRALLKSLRAAQSRIIELDEQIRERAAFDPNAIRPVVATPRRYVLKHGTFRSEIVEFLKSRDSYVPTAAVVAHMASAFAMPMTTNQEQRDALQVVSRELRELTYRGSVSRIVDPRDAGRRLWRWVGL